MKTIIISILLIISITLTGCWIYGEGESVGYVYAVDDGIVWDKVWFKPDMSSTESDCYLINDNLLKARIKDASFNGLKMKIKYDKHLITLSSCGSDAGTSDEIKSIELIN